MRALNNMLWTAYLMMVENDGLNERQLHEYARVDGWLRAFWFEEGGASCARLAIRDDAWPPNNDFRAVTMWLLWFLRRLDGKLVTDIFCALRLTDGEHPSVFPALRTLRVFDLGPMHGSLLEAVESFTTTRRRSSGCVQEELKKHLVVWHAYRIVCPYCGDFEFTPRYSDLFLEHLASKHPEVPHRDTDTLIANSASQSSLSSDSGNHGTQQNDLHASVIFERFTEFKVTSILDGSHTRLDAVHFLHSP
ncbi:hypothetical protein EDB84DRAFT_1628480 [Lactarius hengduanensis]|nr:hypothetical protein EDB84DRAFT_1628480 [Lactarius hengduanensis]